MNYSFEVMLPREAIVEALARTDYDQLLSVIQEIDLMQADVGFTENLVKILVKSLKKDYDAGAQDEIDLPFIDWSKV